MNTLIVGLNLVGEASHPPEISIVLNNVAIINGLCRIAALQAGTM